MRNNLPENQQKQSFIFAPNHYRSSKQTAVEEVVHPEVKPMHGFLKEPVASYCLEDEIGETELSVFSDRILALLESGDLYLIESGELR